MRTLGLNIDVAISTNHHSLFPGEDKIPGPRFTEFVKSLIIVEDVNGGSRIKEGRVSEWVWGGGEDGANGLNYKA